MCFSGLLYQINDLIHEYMSGRTVVSIKIGRAQSDALPGISVCVPFPFSLKAIAEHKPELRTMYKEYLGYINITSPDNQTKRRMDEITKEIWNKVSSSSSYNMLVNYGIPSDR